MSRLGVTLEVAKWEFRRFFKIRAQLLSVLVLLVLGAVMSVFTARMMRTALKAQIVVLNPSVLPFQAPPRGRIELVPAAGRSESTLAELVSQGKLAGVVRFISQDEAELLVSRQPAWLGELQSSMSAARREAALKSSGIPAEKLRELLAPVVLRTTIREAGRAPSLATVPYVSIFTVVLLMGIIIGSGTLLAGITGEKRLRITEQLLSVITPQVWIDGKILGIAAMVMASLLLQGGTVLAAIALYVRLGKGTAIQLPAASPLVLLVSLVLALLGFLFWFAFFGAFAATIDDPHNNSRGGLMMLPLVPTYLAYAVAAYPDRPIVRVLSWIPPISPSVMSARLILSPPAAWEVVLAIVLLLASIWFLRIAAGKIFAVGMLMYGKQPSWSEVWRWLRET